MADNVLFEIDASKILAKLHLAGIKAGGLLDAKTDFYINTGIIDDDPKATPENPGKVTFDLTNSSTEYQLGYVTTVSYYKSYDVEKDMNALAMVRSKVFGDGSKVDDKLKDNKEEYEKFEAAANSLTSIVAARAGGSIKISIDDLKTDDGVKKLKDALAKAVENEEEEYNQTIAAAKEKVAEKLNGYMQTFAGKDNMTEQIKADSLGMINIADEVKDSTDKTLVKMFEIQEMSDQAKAKQVAQFQAKFKQASDKEKSDGKTFKNCTQKICFYVTYNLNVDK